MKHNLSFFGFFRTAGLVAAFFSFSALISAHAQEIKVGYFELPPRAYLGKADLAEGSEVAKFREIAAKMGVKKVTFNRYPFARMLAELETGEIDAALILGKNPERSAKFHYPASPYFSVQSGLVLRADSPLKEIKSSADLKALNIGVMLGSNLTPTMKDESIRKDFLSGGVPDARNLEKLLSNRIDAYYSPDVELAAIALKEAKAEKTTKVIILPDPATPIFTVFNKKSGALFGANYEKALEAFLKEKGERK